MKVLVINCGSSSIKYELLEMEDEKVLAEGLLEKVGEKASLLSHHCQSGALKINRDIASHEDGLELVVQILMDKEKGVVKDASDIFAVGHRVVQGGEKFIDSSLIDDEVIQAIRQYQELAPLHNPPNLAGIMAMRRLLPEVPQVAVFDTAFHHTMPEAAFLYAIPTKYYRKYALRKYGFHGTSHRYVAEKAAEVLKSPLSELNLITCHLGNGCSMTAIRQGKVVDTSMGFTPLEGLVMGTRCGDIDAAAVLFLAEKEKLSFQEIGNLLNKESGLLGLSGLSNDVRVLEKAAREGNSKAALALEVFAYRARKYIGAYLAVLGRADAIIFTAGIGENSQSMRSAILKGLSPLGISLDEARNQNPEEAQGIITTEDSPIKVLVIRTHEETLIARDTLEVVKRAASAPGGGRR